MNGLSVMPCVQQVQALSGRSYRQYEAGRALGRTADMGAGNLIRISGSRVQTRRSGQPDRAVNGPRPGSGLRDHTRAAETAEGKAERKGLPAPVRLLILALLFAVMIAGFQTMTGASSRQQEKKYKYYTTVTIGYGEDITDIVFRYCDSSKYASPEAYVREICEINCLPCKKGELPDLPAGSKIVIPYYDTEIK